MNDLDVVKRLLNQLLETLEEDEGDIDPQKRLSLLEQALSLAERLKWTV